MLPHVSVKHQSVPSANIPQPRALFSHGQIPEDFAKTWTKTPTPGKIFYFFNTVIVILA